MAGRNSSEVHHDPPRTLMFGPYGGGMQGDYATGYIRAFEVFAAFVHQVH